MLDKSIIGRRSRPFVNEVEKGAIRRFAEALGDDNPLYHDEEYARNTRHGGIIAPPSFPVSLRVGSNVREGLPIDNRKVLHGEMEFEYFRPLRAGDVITCQARIVDYYTKEGKSGTMEFIVTEITGIDASGKDVFKSRSTTVIRG
jgi:acyl dehydratase